MSDQDRELIMRLLKQSVITLCRETVLFRSKIEIDGLICITVEDNPHPIVVKIHENIHKGLPNLHVNCGSSPLSTGGEFPSSRKRKRDLLREFSVVNSPADSSEGITDAGLPTASDGSVDESGEMLTTPEEGTAEQTPLGSRPGSLTSGDDGKPEKQVSIQKQLVSAAEDVKNEEENEDDVNMSHVDSQDDPQLESSSDPGVESTSRLGSDSSFTSFVFAPESIHTQSTAIPHAQGLLCKRCFTVVPDPASFDSHNLREHSLFTCKICFKGFTARNNLKRHFRLHTGVKPYKCPVCSQGFTRRDDLKAHHLRHSYTKPFRCGLCGKGYTDRSCVRNHMSKEHHTRLLHVCPQCGEGFNDTEQFSAHKKDHPEFQSFQCECCAFIGINALDLMKHSLTHSTKTYCCGPCSITFSDPFNYTAHLKRHRTDEKFTSYNCCFCDSELSTYEHFVRHEYTHSQNRSHACHLCSKHFRYPSDLKVHMATHAPSLPVNLIQSSADTPDQGPADENATSSSQYWCTECHVGFATEDSLHGHIYEAHESTKHTKAPVMIELRKTKDFPGDSLDMSNASTAVKPDSVSDEPRVPMVDLSKTKLPLPGTQIVTESGSCLFDTKQFTRQRISNSAENMVDLNGDKISIKQEKIDPDDSMNSFGDNFMQSNSDYYANGSPGNDSAASSSFEGDQGQRSSKVKEIVLERIHIRSPGFERVVTPDVLFRSQSSFQCTICNEMFSDFNSFEFHGSTLHRRFVCEYCGKVFTAKPNRERHVRYHTGERPYKCDLCDQTFFRGDDLKYHRTTRHSGIKPFRCNVCGMTFAWDKDLERHVRHYCHQ